MADSQRRRPVRADTGRDRRFVAGPRADAGTPVDTQPPLRKPVRRRVAGAAPPVGPCGWALRARGFPKPSRYSRRPTTAAGSVLRARPGCCRQAHGRQPVTDAGRPGRPGAAHTQGAVAGSRRRQVRCRTREPPHRTPRPLEERTPSGARLRRLSNTRSTARTKSTARGPARVRSRRSESGVTRGSSISAATTTRATHVRPPPANARHPPSVRPSRPPRGTRRNGMGRTPHIQRRPSSRTDPTRRPGAGPRDDPPAGWIQSRRWHSLAAPSAGASTVPVHGGRAGREGRTTGRPIAAGGPTRGWGHRT